MIDPHYVYIIGHSDVGGPVGPVKIGITKSLGSRLAVIQTGNWRRVEVVYQFLLQDRDLAREVERLAHESLAENRMAGEWFGVEPFAALETLCNVVFGVIQDHYREEDRANVMTASGAADHFSVVVDYYWGPIQ